MTVFHEVTLALPFALGASGGVERRVDIVALGSGREARNAPWAHGRRTYEVGGVVRTLDDLHALISFFEARRGKLYGFRFRDPFDFKSCPPGEAPSSTDQVLGVGDGARAAFQLIKTYGDAAASYMRVIAKPVAGGVSAAISGVETPAFSIDAASGLLTFATPPAPEAVVTAGFLFDTPVRFDVDRLDLALDGFGAGRAVSAPLVEIVP